MSAVPEPPRKLEVAEFEVDDATAVAFMMYTDIVTVPGVYAVLRAKKDWGWLVTWSYMDGSEVKIKVLQRQPKRIIH